MTTEVGKMQLGIYQPNFDNAVRAAKSAPADKAAVTDVNYSGMGKNDPSKIGDMNSIEYFFGQYMSEDQSKGSYIRISMAEADGGQALYNDLMKYSAADGDTANLTEEELTVWAREKGYQGSEITRIMEVLGTIDDQLLGNCMQVEEAEETDVPTQDVPSGADTPDETEPSDTDGTNGADDTNKPKPWDVAGWFWYGVGKLAGWFDNGRASVK